MAHRKSKETKRGRHKKRFSKETKKWEVGHLIPRRPSWMDKDEYEALAKLREQL